MNTTATTGTDEPEIQLHQQEDSILNQPVAEGTVTAEALTSSEPPDGSREAQPADDSAPTTGAHEPAAATEASTGYGTLGQRLRAAREARGWSLEDVSGRLHIPLQIIQRLELEQFEKIGYGIYLRGYLNSYARLVDVPTILVDAVVREHNEAPPLVASGTISHSRYLYQRYSVSALYLILTGVIIVPAVMLAMRAGLQPAVTQLAPVEAPANSAATDAGTAATALAETAAPPAQSAPSAPETPAANNGQETALVASLAPFPALGHKETAAAAATPRVETPAASPAAAANGMHTLKLTLKEESWVEVVAANGEKLEYGLLPGGSMRTYSSNKALEVRLGNCNGAQVETDGKLQDLTPFRRANIARFKLFADGEAISRSE
jgi:cytoskeleton protein RodZ